MKRSWRSLSLQGEVQSHAKIYAVKFLSRDFIEVFIRQYANKEEAIASKMVDSEIFNSLKIKPNSNQHDGSQIIGNKIYKKIYSIIDAKQNIIVSDKYDLCLDS